MDEEKPGLGDNPEQHIFGPSQKEVQQVNQTAPGETPLQKLASSRFGRAVAAVLGIGAASAIPTEAHTPSQVEQQVTAAPTADTITVAGQEFGLPLTEGTEVQPTTTQEPELIFPHTAPEKLPAELFGFHFAARLGQIVNTDQFKQLPNFNPKATTTLVDGNIEYHFSSALLPRDHLVITDPNGRVIFKRVVTAIPESWELPFASAYWQKYGQPEAKIVGHSRYGRFQESYLYPSQGFTLVCHPAGPEVNEILIYQPTTQEEFLSSWGSEIGKLPAPP